jgi:hypothetical protein
MPLTPTKSGTPTFFFYNQFVMGVRQLGAANRITQN